MPLLGCSCFILFFRLIFYLPSHPLSELSLSLRKRCWLQPGKPLPSPTSRQARSYPWSVSFSSLAEQRDTQTRMNPDPGRTTTFPILSPGFLTNPCLGTCQVCGTGLGTIPITAHFWRVTPRKGDPTGTGAVSHPPPASPSLRAPSGRAAQPCSSLLGTERKHHPAGVRRGKWKRRQELLRGEKQPPPPRFGQRLNRRGGFSSTAGKSRVSPSSSRSVRP